MTDKPRDHQLAWLEAPGNLVLIAESEAQGDRQIRFPWESAISRLITGINITFGEEKFRYLRKRIFTSTSENLWDQQLVKLCAKRVTWSCQKPSYFSEGSRIEGSRILNVGMTMKRSLASCKIAEINKTTVTHQTAIEIVRNLATQESQKWDHQKRHNSPRSVAAIAVAHNGEILAANVNTNVEIQGNNSPPARLQFMHAEVNMILSLAAKGMEHFPRGVRIYTSLKPCRMCAALLIEFSSTTGKTINNTQKSLETMQVFSLADDPGPQGQHNILAGCVEII